MALIFAACPNVRTRPQENVGRGLLKIDWLGAFLHMSTLVLFDAACISSGTTLSWNSGAIALWVLSGVIAIIYILQQWFSLFTTPADRIFPVAVLRTRTGFLVMVCTFMSCNGYAVTLYYLPLFYAFTRGDDAIQTAVHMLPFICVYIAGAIGSGVLLPRVRRYAAMYLMGGLLMAGGAGALQSIHSASPLGQSMGISTLIGLGVGSTLQLGASVLNLGLPQDIRMDSGIAMTITVYSGTTVALAVAGCIYQNIGFEFVSDALSGLPLSSSQIRDTLAGAASPTWRTDLSPELVASAIDALTLAVIRVFYFSVAAGAVMAISALLMKWEALQFTGAREESTEQREVA